MRERQNTGSVREVIAALENFQKNAVVLLTNNPLAQKECDLPVQAVTGDTMDVLKAVRDRVHRGWRLLSFPLGASIKMLHSPVVSVWMRVDAGAPDPFSLLQIENDIERILTVTGKRGFDPNHKESYALVDWNRMQNASTELQTYGKGENIAT